MFLQLLVLAVVTSAAHLPQAPYINPCARDDPRFNECAVRSAKEALPTLAKGDKSLGIPPLNPMHIPEVKIIDGTFSLILKDLVLYGLEKAIPEKTNFDFEKKHFSLEFTIPKFVILSKYEINGRILLLPITGSGDLNTTMTNGKLVINHDFELKKIKGVDHQKIINFNAKFVPRRFYMTLTNLFNGDKALGNHMNNFLNENWQEVYKEMGPTIDTTFQTILSSVLTSVNDIIPFDDLFPKTLPK